MRHRFILILKNLGNSSIENHFPEIGKAQKSESF